MRLLLFKIACLNVALAALMLGAPVAYAADDLDVTMRMVTDDADLTDSVVREIELSQPIRLQPGQQSAGDVAREAREKGREFGQSVSEQAREAARLRQQERSTGRPDRPEPPENPGRPESLPN